MVSAAIDVQDESWGSGSNLSMDNQVKGVHQKDQFTPVDDYAPKVRKPYTITKQRERWTDEEHNKFLEALKLYGRAWRRIEEHVGTKTAVQIRSHAQKFFSKVVRESDTGDVSSVKSIEIPPPRPKRKPVHPYPRKLAASAKASNPTAEQSTKYPSLELENESPTSVLSAVGSDSLCAVDMDLQNGSPSISCVKLNLSMEENRSPSPTDENTCSTPYEPLPEKLELFPQEDMTSAEEDSCAGGSVSTGRSLKLFGKTLLVPKFANCEVETNNNNDDDDVMPVQMLPWNLIPGNLNESSSTPLSCVPWWSFGGVPFPFPQLHNPFPIKPHQSFESDFDKEIEKDGSLTGSNTGSVVEGEGGESDKNIETQSGSLVCESNEQKRGVVFNSKEKSAFLDWRPRFSKSSRGFVPYKRCLSERESLTISLTINNGEMEQKRIRVCS